MGRPKSGSFSVPTIDRIREAAESAFGERGYVGARLEDIAAVASIRRPSLLYYFSTKEVLYAAVVNRLFDDLRASLTEQIGKEGDFATRLVALAESFRDFAFARPAFGQIVLRDILDHRDPVFHLLQAELVPVLDLVCEFIKKEGRGQIARRLPVRGAIVQFCADVLLRSGAGPLRTPLWGAKDQTRAMIRNTFLRG